MSASDRNEEKGHPYVLQARDEQQQYAAAMLRENESLRAKVAVLESDHRRAVDQHQAATGELDRLRERLAGIADENQRYAEKHHQIESQSSNLTNLYVASYQLHSSVDRDTVLGTILEIVINLIGSEEVAIYQTGQDGRYHLASSFGVDTERLSAFTPGNGAIGRVVAHGEIFADDQVHGGEHKLTACVPLRIDDRIIGAILVFSLLEHKPSLQPVDHELFDLLAVHAATALYCASLHATAAVVAA